MTVANQHLEITPAIPDEWGAGGVARGGGGGEKEDVIAQSPFAKSWRKMDSFSSSCPINPRERIPRSDKGTDIRSHRGGPRCSPLSRERNRERERERERERDRE